MKALIIAASIVVATSGSVFAQGSAPTQPPAAPTAQPQQERTDPQAAARARYDEWVQVKRECFRSANAVEGTHWRFRPDNRSMIQVVDSVWLNPGNVNLQVLRTCQ